MTKEILENKLREIDTILRAQYKKEANIGVLSGVSGISLFQFYYSKYLDINDHLDIGTKMLEKSIDKINDGYNIPTYCDGIAGKGWVIDHLEQEGFVDFDTDDLLIDLDEYLYNGMLSDMKKGNYDFLHGGIGYAYYFLNRYKNTKSEKLKKKYKTILLEFIDSLKELSEQENNGNYKWSSVLNLDTGEKGYNLSLSHGISSIIGILTKLHSYQDFKDSTKAMLIGAISYVLSTKKNNNKAFSLFPSSISKNANNRLHDKSRLAWCYGDLGIGLRLLYASKTLNNKALEENAISILVHASKRTTFENHLVIDAGMCHGSYGNAQIFMRAYKETKLPVFKKASEFWIQDGLSKATYEDGYAGYKQRKGINQEWLPNVTLLEGISGIGLTIIDYLADFDSNWDECLMIS